MQINPRKTSDNWWQPRYGGHPDPTKRWIITAWPLKRGDTFTTAIDGKVCTYRVTGFSYSLTDGLCAELEQEPLGKEFEEALYENLSDLYVKS